MKSCTKNRIVILFAVLLLLSLFAANLLYGSVDIPCADVLKILSGGEAERDVWRIIVLETRLPQALTALL